MTFSQILQEVIRLSQEAYQARVAGATGKDFPPVTSGYAPATALLPATDTILRQFLNRQPPQVVYLLIAIMYLGRGDFAPPDLSNRVNRIRQSLPYQTWAVSEMMGKMSLGDFLERGQRELDKAGINLDTLIQS